MKVTQMTLALALVVGIASASYGYSGRRRLPAKRKRKTAEELYEIIKPYEGHDLDDLPTKVKMAKAQLRALGLPDQKPLPPKPVLKRQTSKRQRTLKWRQSADKIEEPMLRESTPASNQPRSVFVVRPKQGGNGYGIHEGVMERENEDGTNIVTIKGKSVTVPQSDMVFFDANNRADALAKISKRRTAMSKHGGKISNLANGPAKPISKYGGSKAALANVLMAAARKQKTKPVPKAARKASSENNVRRRSSVQSVQASEPKKIRFQGKEHDELTEVWVIFGGKVQSAELLGRFESNSGLSYNVRLNDGTNYKAIVKDSRVELKTPENKKKLEDMARQLKAGPRKTYNFKKAQKKRNESKSPRASNTRSIQVLD